MPTFLNVYRLPGYKFGFLKGSSTSDAGTSLAEVRLVALDIKGAFDQVWWDGFLEHL